MASQDPTGQLHRFLYDDSESSVARFHAGSPYTPRRHPFTGLGGYGLHLWGTTDDAVYNSYRDVEYAVSSAGRPISDTIEDEDSFQSPADFIPTNSRAGVASRAAGSSGRSGYTASPAMYYAPSTHSSEASTFAPSIFTHASQPTSAGLSSHPPRNEHFATFMIAAADNPPIPPEAAAHPLWCELCVTGNCPATFPIDQTREWIQHHCDHLADRYPARLVCWFCDHVPFKATGRSPGERYANFLDRMEHIREHIADDHRTVDDMRPDFSMINHLADHRIIEDSMRRVALGYSELPEALRLPGSSAGGDIQPYPYPAQRRPPGPPLAYDLDRERRHQRPRGGGRRPRHASMHTANA